MDLSSLKSKAKQQNQKCLIQANQKDPQLGDSCTKRGLEDNQGEECLRQLEAKGRSGQVLLIGSNMVRSGVDNKAFESLPQGL